MASLSRRRFLETASLSAAALAAASVGAPRVAGQGGNGGGGGGAVAISSGNGLRTTRRTVERIAGGSDPLEAIVDGIAIVEADPDDMSVGYGGLPNENCVVQLDASVMHGPTHRAGAVAALEDIMHPAAVALEVARRTDHVLLVGRGARDFALKLGFQEENLLTPKAREAWLRWKAAMNDGDDWLEESEWDIDADPADQARRHRRREDAKVLFTFGTIHCSALTPGGDLAGCTSTSGLSWKLPGRVGDSPIIGAGLYTDNEVGSAGATGRGEAAIQNCAAHSVVQRLRAGDTPTEACLNVLRDVARHTKSRRLLRADGTPNFGLTLYALRKDGEYGAATMRRPANFAVSDANGHRLAKCAMLYPE